MRSASLTSAPCYACRGREAFHLRRHRSCSPRAPSRGSTSQRGNCTGKDCHAKGRSRWPSTVQVPCLSVSFSDLYSSSSSSSFLIPLSFKLLRALLCRHQPVLNAIHALDNNITERLLHLQAALSTCTRAPQRPHGVPSLRGSRPRASRARGRSARSSPRCP